MGTGQEPPRPLRAAAGAVPPTLADAAVVLFGTVLLSPLLVGPLRQAFDGAVGTAVGLLAYGALLGLVSLAWCGLRRRGGLRGVLGGRPSPSQLLVAGVLGLALGVVLGVIVPPLVEQLMEALGFEIPPPQQEIRRALADPQARWLTVTSAVVAAPLGEEIAFRGVLFRALRRAGVVLAVLVSAVVFAALHGLAEPASTFAYMMVVLTPLAVVLALLVERHGHVWGAATTHAVYNAVSVSVLLLG